MTMHLQQRTTLHGAFADLDVIALALSQVVLSISDSHPTRLTFRVSAAQQDRPIPYHAFLRLWDDAGTVRGAAQSALNPLFEGYVEEIQPVASNVVAYVAFDSSYRTQRDVLVFNAPWLAGDVGADIPPAPPGFAIPRLVYNCKNDADDDWAHQVGQDGTVGQLIAGILEWHTYPLAWLSAAPGDGSVDSSVPYDPADLALLDFRPQEKLVFQTESVRSCLERIQRYDPRLRLLWEPGSRLWRCTRADLAPQVLVDLNAPDIAYPVLSLDLQTSIEQCATAVKIYGPERASIEVFQWWRSPPLVGDPPTPAINTLLPVGDGMLLQEYSTGSGPQQERIWWQWQIADPAKWRSARQLPDWFAALVTEYEWASFRSLQLHCSWDHGTTWNAASGVWFDNLNGTATFSVGANQQPIVPYIRQENSQGESLIPGSTQTIFAPNAMRLIWAPYTTALSVRVPETGHSGTAHTAGLVRELSLYDESLAVGTEYGIPVTTDIRMNQFRTYAQSILDQRKDLVWTGGCVLDGCDYSWCQLNRRVSFRVGDGAGGYQDARWDTIDALLTDVEIDLSEQQTTLTFSSDRLALLGEDAAALKERLQIRAAERRVTETIRYDYRMFTTYLGYQVREIAGVHVDSVVTYHDPLTGALA